MLTWQQNGVYHRASFHGYSLLITLIESGCAYWSIKERRREKLARISGGEIYHENALQLAKSDVQRSLTSHLECLILELRGASEDEWGNEGYTVESEGVAR